jgi:uncharacterized GH25 family protein
VGNINQNQMNKEKHSGIYTGLLFASCFLALTFSGCKKDGPTRAIITVVDSVGKPVSGANVDLWQDTAVNNTNNVQSTLRVKKTTDASGKAQFDFQLEAFLNITAVKGADTGKSYIRLKEHETVSQTVSL